MWEGGRGERRVEANGEPAGVLSLIVPAPKLEALCGPSGHTEPKPCPPPPGPFPAAWVLSTGPTPT